MEPEQFPVLLRLAAPPRPLSAWAERARVRWDQASLHTGPSRLGFGPTSPVLSAHWAERGAGEMLVRFWPGSRGFDIPTSSVLSAWAERGVGRMPVRP